MLRVASSNLEQRHSFYDNCPKTTGTNAVAWRLSSAELAGKLWSNARIRD